MSTAIIKLTPAFVTHGHNFQAFYYEETGNVRINRFYTNGHQNSNFEKVVIPITVDKFEWLEGLEEDELYHALEGMFHNLS